MILEDETVKRGVKNKHENISEFIRSTKFLRIRYLRTSYRLF